MIRVTSRYGPRRKLTVVFLTAVLLITGIPGASSLHAEKYDPNCYVDLYALTGLPEARSNFYVSVGMTGVGFGITLWGGGTKKKGALVGGLILAAAGTASAVYWGRQYARYKRAERCGLNP
jgi:hypothetical protein